jgi:endogenous inhibitor of DNA gyrase (YacG/DUF329 family)
MKHRCPICKTPTDSEKDSTFPFCSERCQDRDLGNWATEKYKVSEAIFDEAEEEFPKSDPTTIILPLDEADDSRS